MKDQLHLIVPPCTLRWFPAGQHCNDATDGDFMLVNRGTLFDKAIDAGQALEAKIDSTLKGFTWCSHVAYIRGGLDNEPMVSQMGRHGYDRVPLKTYRAELYAIAKFNVSVDAVARANSYDEACRDVDYGWGEYLPLILDGLSGQTFVGTWGDAMICSEHATLVAMGLGLFPDRPPAIVIPSRFALWTGAIQP